MHPSWIRTTCLILCLIAVSVVTAGTVLGATPPAAAEFPRNLQHYDDSRARGLLATLAGRVSQ